LRLAAEGATPTKSGIRFDTAFPFERWQALGGRLGAYANSSKWWLGDWLDFGREMYGSRYKLGVALTGLEYKTLRNYAWVARRFKLSRRRDTLSFQHHAEVAALSPEQQDLWLDRAENEGWSRSELRRRLRAELSRPSRSPQVMLSVPVAAEHPWREAARRAGCDLRSWMERTLDEAAATQWTSDH
jgi:hypothetical protein